MIVRQVALPKQTSKKDAFFSPCRRYRYALWRTWNDHTIALPLAHKTRSTVTPTVLKS
jgi:hypothetical protein